VDFCVDTSEASLVKLYRLLNTRTPLNRGDYTMIIKKSGCLDFVKNSNLGPETVEALRQVFVAAIDGVDIAQYGAARCC
jgi:hypothetical protein